MPIMYIVRRMGSQYHRKVSDWDQLVNIEKRDEAPRTTHVTL